MSKFIQFTTESGPIFVLPDAVSSVHKASTGVTILATANVKVSVNESVEQVIKAIDDWFDSKSQVQPELAKPVVKVSQKRLDWLMNLKKGDIVLSTYFNQGQKVLEKVELIEVDYSFASAGSGISIRISKDGEAATKEIDSSWIIPLF